MMYLEKKINIKEAGIKMLNQKQILVVDDNSMTRKIIVNELDKEYKILESINSFDALEKIQKIHFALMIFNVEMPEINGFEIYEQLYTEETLESVDKQKNTKIPVIFITTDNSIENRKKGYCLGASDIIVRPFHNGDILQSVNKILKPGKLLKNLTALIVDDSESARMLVSLTLQNEGMKVMEAENGLIGYNILCKFMNKIDIVITDLRMPEMGGGDFCQKIRNELGLVDLPIIIFTGITDRSEILRVFKSGGNDYLLKPLIKEEMLARILVQIEKTKLNQRLRETIKRLRNTNKIKDNLITVCTHDICSPLSGINGISKQLLQPDSNGLNKEESLNQIKESSESVLNMVRDMLDLLKLESDSTDIEMKIISLNKIAEITVNAVKYIAIKKDQEIVLDLCNYNSYIVGNRNSLIRLFNNLLTNAIKFTPEKGSIVLKINNINTDTVAVEVIDNGIGIKKDDIPYFFDKFTRISQAGTAGEEGTGLGMSIIKEIGDKHNAEIVVDSEYGKGTVIKIIFPRYRDKNKYNELDMNNLEFNTKKNLKG